ncbi:type II secretion system F family protein [Uliginosibacterium paludis]|uniref:Type II secretion system F family protein n=1 Tax=Uliginosibacterium paludis TaxID=1615952 RepID=A0ABV2CUQ0_9RHOO
MKLELIQARRCVLPALSAWLDRVPLRERIHFFFHLEHLLRAGIPLMDALQELREGSGQERIGPILTKLLEKIGHGSSFADAISEHPQVFDPVAQALIRAGENSGNLTQVLAETGSMLRREDEFRAFLRKLSIYPSIVLAVALCAISVSLVFVVPELAKLFKATGAPLPAQTRALLWLSNTIRQHSALLLFALIAAPLSTVLAVRQSAGAARTWDKLKLELPVIGNVYRKIMLARFTSLLALLYAAGIPIMQALALTQGVVTNRIVADALAFASTQVSRGMSLSDAFSDATVFPSLVIRMLRLGEQTGALDPALLNAAHFFEREVRESFEAFQAWIEPALILLLGGLMLWIASAILSPIYDIITRLKI